jgi:hypothetical protein
MSMGGAFGAIGADLSCLSANPAGIGLYHKNEFTFSPSLYSQKDIALYNGTSAENDRYNLRIDNFGMMFAGKTSNTSETGWQTVGMGFAYNRTNTFQSDSYMTGNSATSMMDSWKKTASGSLPGDLDGFNEGLAWNAYLLNQVPGNPTQYTDTIPDGDTLIQSKSIRMRGGMSEWTFGVGGNYSNKIYIGGSIGIPQVKYSEYDVYDEAELHDTVSSFDEYQFNSSLSTVGKGFNARFGLIYRPVDFVRIGIAYQSPTVLRLADTYSSSITSYFGPQQYVVESPTGSYNYRIITPMRTSTSLAFVIGKVAMIGGELELVNYADAAIHATDYAFAEANAAIAAKYTMGVNTKFGAEFRVLPMIFRAGYANYSSPYKPTVNNNASKNYYTFGVGYRDKDDAFFADLGLVVNTTKSNYYFYDQSLVNPVQNKFKSLDMVLTIGLRY